MIPNPTFSPMWQQARALSAEMRAKELALFLYLHDLEGAARTMADYKRCVDSTSDAEYRAAVAFRGTFAQYQQKLLGEYADRVRSLKVEFEGTLAGDGLADPKRYAAFRDAFDLVGIAPGARGVDDVIKAATSRKLGEALLKMVG